MNKKYCPLMLIGFDAPKNNETYDPRTCKKDCAWYNPITNLCAIMDINIKLRDSMDLITETYSNLEELLMLMNYPIELEEEL
jgi:hypothetical protein